MVGMKLLKTSSPEFAKKIKKQQDEEAARWKRLKNMRAQKTKLMKQKDNLSKKFDIDHMNLLQHSLFREMKRCDYNIINSNNILASFKRTEWKRFCGYQNSSTVCKVINELNARKEEFDVLPRGPIGLNIKVEDNNSLKHVEYVLGKKFLNSFLVSTKEDARLLKKVFNRHNYETQIILQERKPKRHNLTANPYKFPRIADLIQSDTWIFNAILDQTAADRTLIVPNDKQATNYLRSLNDRYVIAITKDLKRKVRNCGKSNEYMSVNHQFPLLQSSVYSKAYIENIIKEHKKEKGSFEACFDVNNNKIAAHKEKIKKIDDKILKIQIDEELENSHIEQVQLQRKTMAAMHTDSKNESILTRIQIELCRFQDQLSQCQDRLQNNLTKLNDEKMESEKINKTLKQSKKDKTNMVRNLTKLEKKLNSQYKKKLKVEKSIGKIEKNIIKSKKIIENQREVIEEAKQEFEEAMEGAKKFCPEEKTSKSTSEELKKEADRCQVLIKQAQEGHGGNETEARKLYNAAQKELSNYENQIGEVMRNITGFKAQMNTLGKQVSKLIHVTAESSKAAFRSLLTKRGGTVGKLIFDHERETLDIKVRLASQRKGVFGTNALSGGESSLTQLVFLMALFKDSTSPFHCLDEIDVFLDHPNRSVIFKNLNSMTSNIDKQWIFLTPHDTSCIQRIPDKVKVLHMEKIFASQARPLIPEEKEING